MLCSSLFISVHPRSRTAMKQFIDGTWDKLIFPLLITATIGLAAFYVDVKRSQAIFDERLSSHASLPAHKESQKDMTSVMRSVEINKSEIDGIIKEQRQIIRNIEAKIDSNYILILNEIRALNKELDKINRN